jgi:hypothetical protein
MKTAAGAFREVALRIGVENGGTTQFPTTVVFFV